MRWLATLGRVLLAAGLLAMGLDLARAGEPEALYQQHCAACHGAARTGGMGPALLPESLERLRRPEAMKVIAEGRTATQMPGFGAQLKPDEVAALAAWIYTPVTPAPAWSDADIRASRVVVADASTLPGKPQWRADPMNLFVVVEGGDHHVSLVDGDRFERIHRFESRYALHGGPKFSPDGRFVYFGSRDGWITQYDLWNLTVVAEVRAGLNMRNVAVSSDGQWVMAANYLPRNVVLFDAGLNLVRSIDADVNLDILHRDADIVITVTNRVPMLERDLERIEHSRQRHHELHKEGRAGDFCSPATSSLRRLCR